MMEMPCRFLVVCAGALLLSGCGSRKVSSVNSGDPSGPMPNASPISALSPSQVPAGAQGFTLTVTGTGFTATQSVYWDGSPLTSKYVSSTEMTAEVPASLLAIPHSSPVTVATSAPKPTDPYMYFIITEPNLPGNQSATVSSVGVQAVDMAADPVTGMLYLSTPPSNGVVGSIVKIDPKTSAMTTVASPTAQPGRMAISADGAYMYVGLQSGVVQRYLLPDMTPDITIDLGEYNDPSSGVLIPYYALDLQVDPVNSHTIGVARGVNVTQGMFEQGGVAIYDDATQRAQSVPGVSVSGAMIGLLTWKSDGSYLYGAQMVNGYADLNVVYVMPVDSNGVTLAITYTNANWNLLSIAYESKSGYLYGSDGTIIDPATGATVGSFPLDQLHGGMVPGSVMTFDSSLDIAYFLAPTKWDYYNDEIMLEAFDLQTHTLLGAISMATDYPFSKKIVRFGSDGLVSFDQGSVRIVQGGFVTSPAQ
ncbi:MAG: IPT/TIG domain-containing protein [Acidobacteriota bacterium]|nr:IPT/TIG domain-containing protein [Acidobacteriota bacterium]